MDKFIISIKKKYRERLLSREEQWPPVRGDKLINLQLVETDKTEGFCGDGSGKTIRTPIAYGNLFKAEDGKKPVRKIIVEGNGGMGKTTLCTMLAEEWAEEKLLKEFDCVLLLPLREGKVSSAESLLDLFKLLHSSEKIRSSVIDELEEREGEGVLIIADGWDELEEVKRAKGSFLYSLLFDDVLPLASVLFTSRPSASAPLHRLPSVDRLVEVVGFNEENVKDYINSDFNKYPEKASSLIEQLDNNPLVLSVCSVPLNCAITCHLWHTLDQVLPSTLTELYTDIIQNIMFRNIKKKFPDTALGLSLKRFDSIPKNLQKSFALTCKFAFESLLKDKIVFSEDELASFSPEVLDSSENFLCFGLLQSALSLLPVGQGLSFHFLHLTIQEFLAALHFVTLPSEEQQKIFKDHAKSNRFANVWKFAFGLGSKTQGSSSGRVSRNVVCLEDKVVDGFVSALSDEGDRLLLCHCALESKDDVVTIKVARKIGGHFEQGHFNSIAHTPHDCVAVYHVLHFASHGSVDISLNGCGLGDKQLRRLTDILSNGQLKVKRLCLDDGTLTSAGVNDMFARGSTSFSSLDQLSLDNSNIDSESVNSIVTSFNHTSCKSLTWLSLSHNPLGVPGIQALERAVKAGVLVNLSFLYLCNTLTSDMDINGALLATFTKSIASRCPHLSHLNLSGNRLGVPGACAIGEALPLLTYGRKLFQLDLRETMLNNTDLTTLATDSQCQTIQHSNTGDLLNINLGPVVIKFNSCSESEARRCLVLTEWERTCSPPQNEELLSEFLRMWDELLWDLCYFAHVIVRYPGLYGLTTEVKGQDESQSLEMSDQPTDSVQSLFKDDQQQTDSIEEPTDCPPVKKMRVSVSPPTTPTGKHQHDENTDFTCQSPPLKKARLSPDYLSFLPPTPDSLISTNESGFTRPDCLTSTDDSTCPTVVSTHRLEQQGAEKSISELSLRVLTVELRDLTKPIEFGIHLNIPQSTLVIVEHDHPLDTNGQKIALFKFIANNNESLGITWSSVADALLDIHAGNLSLSIREKYCSAVHGGSN